MNFTFSEISELLPFIGGGIISGIMVLFLLSKFIASYDTSKTEGIVVGMMRDELSRLSAQNTQLSAALSEFQREILELKLQLTNLSIENTRLHSEVCKLTGQIAKFTKPDRRNFVN